MRSPFAVKPTIEGVVRPPSEFWITTGSPFSITATQEFVVPKSIPIILPIIFTSFYIQFILSEETISALQFLSSLLTADLQFRPACSPLLLHGE